MVSQLFLIREVPLWSMCRCNNYSIWCSYAAAGRVVKCDIPSGVVVHLLNLCIYFRARILRFFLPAGVCVGWTCQCSNSILFFLLMARSMNLVSWTMSVTMSFNWPDPACWLSSGKGCMLVQQTLAPPLTCQVDYLPMLQFIPLTYLADIPHSSPLPHDSLPLKCGLLEVRMFSIIGAHLFHLNGI